jgi:hypothetical protein
VEDLIIVYGELFNRGGDHVSSSTASTAGNTMSRVNDTT